MGDGGPVIPDFGTGSACETENHSFCWGWVQDHWGDTLQPALLQHIKLAVIAVAIGFVLAFAAALVAYRYRRADQPIGLPSDFQASVQNRGFSHVDLYFGHFHRSESGGREPHLVGTPRKQRTPMGSVGAGRGRALLRCVRINSGDRRAGELAGQACARHLRGITGRKDPDPQAPPSRASHHRLTPIKQLPLRERELGWPVWLIAHGCGCELHRPSILAGGLRIGEGPLDGRGGRWGRRRGGIRAARSRG